MKILMVAVNAKFIHTNIAIRFIKGYCHKRLTSDIEICEYTINNYAEDIINDIYIKKPDIAAFSCYIWNIEMIIKISRVLKMLIPDMLVVLGGPEVSYNSEDILKKNQFIDIIIKGEGEQSSFELYSALENNKSYDTVSGITWRNSYGEIISNKNSVPLDMALLPFPYENLSETEHKICYYEASRGCPFSCRYCLSSVEKGVRFAPIEKVKSELKRFIDYQVKQVKFVDRTFNANNKFACQIVKFIIENDNGITNFHFEVAAETIKDELIELLGTARPGLFQLEIGVQTTNIETLCAISRTGEFQDIVRVTERIKSYNNIHVHLDLIAGLPYENLESFKKSFNDVYYLQPHQLQLGFLKVLHGSSMEKLCEEYGIVYSPYIPYEVLYTDWLSFDDILYLKKIEEMTELYYNSCRFLNSLRYLVKCSNSPFDAYDRLASCRSEIFTENISHNKNDAYSFLIKALEKFINPDMDLFCYILRFDYLLHEKPKGTPEWTEKYLNMYDKDDIYELVVRKNIFSVYFPEMSVMNPKDILRLCHIEKMPVNPLTYERKDVCILINYTKRDLCGNALFIITESPEANQEVKS